MGYECDIIADSLSPLGHRLTTFELGFPRFILAEFNTHRTFSRNSASSRAIPVRKQLVKILEDPFYPVYWGKNRPGMQATEELSPGEQAEAKEIWLEAMCDSVFHVIELQLGVANTMDLTFQSFARLAYTYNSWGEVRGGERKRELLIEMLSRWDIYFSREDALAAHKQIANRPLEPYMWHTVIVTATEWDNFFALRTDANPQPEIKEIALMMRDMYKEHEPTPMGFNSWHMPYVSGAEMIQHSLTWEIAKKLSVGRAARVSYLTHDGTREPEKDIELHDSLARNGHISPYEHVARPMSREELHFDHGWSGNFCGWHQYRKDIVGEANYGEILAMNNE